MVGPYLRHYPQPAADSSEAVSSGERVSLLLGALDNARRDALRASFQGHSPKVAAAQSGLSADGVSELLESLKCLVPLGTALSATHCASRGLVHE